MHCMVNMLTVIYGPIDMQSYCVETSQRWQMVACVVFTTLLYTSLSRSLRTRAHKVYIIIAMMLLYTSQHKPPWLN